MVEITCEMTKKANYDYFMYMQKKAVNVLKSMGIMFVAFAVLYAIVAFTDIVVEDLAYDIVFLLLLVALGLFLIFICKPLLNKSFEKVYNSNKFLLSKPVFTYNFSDRNYKILVTSNFGMEECTYSYDMLNTVIETDEYFYLCFASNSAYIIIKSAGDKDTIIKIQEILKEKLGARYVTQLEPKQKQTNN